MNPRPRSRMALRAYLPVAAAWAAALATAFACAASPPAPTPLTTKPPLSPEIAEGTVYEERIIWQSKVDRVAEFIPQRVWDSTPFEELPIPELSRASLLYWLGRGPWPQRTGTAAKRFNTPPDPVAWLAEQRARFQEPIADCQRPRVNFREVSKRPSGSPMPLRQMVYPISSGVVGEIVAVVPGADPGGAPMEAVYLRVEEILTDHGGVLAPGEVIAFLRRKGRFTLQGFEFCDEGENTLLDTQPGERILVGGPISRSDSGLMSNVYELRLKDGMLQPEPTLNISDVLPMPLALLKEQQARHLAQEGQS